MASRPSKLTPEIEQKILAFVRVGAAMEVACKAAGVNDKTVRRWREQGRAGKQPFASFLEKLESAEAEAECQALLMLHQAGRGFVEERIPGTDRTRKVQLTGDWRAKAFLLERKMARRWGQKVREEVDRALAALIAHYKATLPQDAYALVLDATNAFASSYESSGGPPAEG